MDKENGTGEAESTKRAVDTEVVDPLAKKTKVELSATPASGIDTNAAQEAGSLLGVPASAKEAEPATAVVPVVSETDANAPSNPTAAAASPAAATAAPEAATAVPTSATAAPAADTAATAAATSAPAATADAADASEELDCMTVCVKSISYRVEEAQFELDFEEHGEIEEMTFFEGWGKAYVTYATKDAVASALKMNDDEYYGRKLSVTLADKKDLKPECFEALVKGLPVSVDEDAIKSHFASCGEVVKVRLRPLEEGKSNRLAYVVFKTEDGLFKALELDGQKFQSVDLSIVRAEPQVKGKGKKGKDGKSKGKDKGKGKGKGKGKKGKRK
jgi:hypothetical protein